MKVLIVCLGNTCRSPMARGILAKLALEKNVRVEVRTAGLAHHPNQPVADKAVAVMKEIGVDISDDYSKPLTADALKWADIILPLSESIGDDLLEDYPEVGVKIRRLGKKVCDPYGGSLDNYRAVRDMLQELLSSFSPLTGG